MKLFFIGFLILSNVSVLQSQSKTKFSLEVNYGLFGNFFVREFDELGGPANKQYFYLKDFLGTSSGISGRISVSKKSSLFLEYTRTVNAGRKNYFGQIENTGIQIDDFNIRYFNNFFQGGYSRKFQRKKSSFEIDGGLYILHWVDQSISVENFDRFILMDERNFKNAGASEAGIFLGGSFLYKIDTKFDLGIRTRAYYTFSSAIMEGVSLTPVLRYNF